MGCLPSNFRLLQQGYAAPVIFRLIMAIIDDLTDETREIVAAAWDRRNGDVVPEPEDLSLENEAVDLEATFLYADLADSTE